MRVWNVSTPRVSPHIPTRAREWRRTFVRYLRVWVGVLCLGGQFSTAFHELLVEHVRCPEHGEWVHVDGEHVAASEEPTPDGPVFAASDAADDHCLLCSDLRKLALLAPLIPALRAPTLGGDAAASGRRSPAYSAHIYSFAPKTSPPA